MREKSHRIRVVASDRVFPVHIPHSSPILCVARCPSSMNGPRPVLKGHRRQRRPQQSDSRRLTLRTVSATEDLSTDAPRRRPFSRPVASNSFAYDLCAPRVWEVLCRGGVSASKNYCAMEEFLRDIRRLAHSAYSKLYTFLKEANPAALQLTGAAQGIGEGKVSSSVVGLLGIAAVLAGVYHFRALRRRNRGNAHNRPPREAWNPNPRRHITATCCRVVLDQGMCVQCRRLPNLEWVSEGWGIRTITISAPGVLLEEWDPEKLEEGANIRPDAAEIIKELADGMHVYILAHVKSDVGEMAIRAALESAKILGAGRRQLQPHRLVFCEKLKGKVSLVRQIEPQLHIDGSSETLEELQRFIPHLYHVVRKGHSPAACKTNLVSCGPTLADVLNVQVFN